MSETAEAVLGWLVSVPDALVYVIIGAAAAIENIVPVIPGDVVVVIGGVIAGAGGANPRALFLVVWLSNVGSALGVYALGRRYGPAFFTRRFGSFLLAPRQVDALALAYRRFGFPIIFFSRFLPVFRPIVPVFAGVAHLGFWGTAVPIAGASAIWYGLLVYLGTIAGENWRPLLESINRVSDWLWAAAAVLLVLFAIWWWRSRSAGAHADLDDSR